MEMTYILQIAQIVVYAIIATVFVMVTRGRVDTVEAKIETRMGAVETQVASLHLSNLRLGDILTQIAVQRTEINSVQEDIRDLRHGRGWVALTGEYDSKGKIK